MDGKDVQEPQPEPTRKELPDTLQTEADEMYRTVTLGLHVIDRDLSSGQVLAYRREGIGLENKRIFEHMVMGAMGNRRTVTSESEIVLERSCLDKFVFDHRRSWVNIWDLIRDLAILYSLITTMFFLAFAPPSLGVLIFDIVIWAFFVVDLVLRFLLSYEDEENRLIMSFRSIAIQYCKSWFLPDLLAIVPLQFSDYPEIEYYFRMIRLLKVSGALNLVDGTGLGAVLMFVAGRRGDKHSIVLDLATKSIGSILFILILVTFYTYSMACLWFWFSKKCADLEGIRFIGKGPSFGDFFPGANSWQQLQRSWYFMITTLVTVGYGDLGPTNIYETLLLIFILATGVTTYSFIIGQFNSLVAEIDSIESNRFSDFTVWIERLETLHSTLPLALKQKLLAEFSYYNSADRLKDIALRWWEADNTEDLTLPGDMYLKQLPGSTVKDLKIYLFSDVFARFKIFFGEEDFKYDICFHFHPRRYQPGEFLLTEGEEVQEIFFSLKGEVAMGPVLSSEFVSVVKLTNRAIVGDYSALLHVPSFSNFKAVGTEPVSGFSVPTKPFLAILTEKYPQLIPKMIDFSRKRATFARKAIEQYTESHGIPTSDENSDDRMGIPRLSVCSFAKPDKSKVLEQKAQEMVLPTQRNRLQDLADLTPRVEIVSSRFDGEIPTRRNAAIKKITKLLKRELSKTRKEKKARNR